MSLTSFDKESGLDVCPTCGHDFSSGVCEKDRAAGDILLLLVTAKLYKDIKGKDASYEKAKDEAWALAKEYLEVAMPNEYLSVVDSMESGSG